VMLVVELLSTLFVLEEATTYSDILPITT
jgi:hypothetical protein